MSANRKLQTEIAQVLKKVEEGVALFDDIWGKVYSAGQQSLKEKYEGDLKKEIKKLQRLRDQIKTWLGSSEIKDKNPLTEARKVIESKMEQFKICEKDTKTKAYSKEGLARDSHLDPKEIAKEEKREWLNDCLSRLGDLIDSVEADLEKIANKKKSKEQVDKMENRIKKNRWHIARLEQVLKLMENDDLDVSRIEKIKDDVDYYIESAVDDDGTMGVDDEFDIYEDLALDSFTSSLDRDLESDIATGAETSAAQSESNLAAASSNVKSSDVGTEDGKISSAANTAPTTVPAAKKPPTPTLSTLAGIAGIAAIGKPQVPPPGGKPPTIVPPAKAVVKATPVAASAIGVGVKATVPVIGVPSAAPQAGAPKSAAATAATASGAAAKKSTASVLVKSGGDDGDGDKEELAAATSWASALGQNANTRDQAAATNQQQSTKIATSAPGSVAVTGATQAQSTSSSESSTTAGSFPNQSNAQNSSFFGIPPSNPVGGGASAAAAQAILQPIGGVSQLTRSHVALSNEVLVAAHMLKQSYFNSPESAEIDRQAGYTPRNPYTTHASYPTKPPSSSENTALFERLPPDTLFFAFYYQQGGYQQFLAAKQLKKHSWRFHKKYMTWFQRHEDPKIATEDYEEGSYVYFDNENDWCTLIKQDFKFEFAFLEDEL